MEDKEKRWEFEVPRLINDKTVALDALEPTCGQLLQLRVTISEFVDFMNGLYAESAWLSGRETDEYGDPAQSLSLFMQDIQAVVDQRNSQQQEIDRTIEYIYQCWVQGAGDDMEAEEILLKVGRIHQEDLEEGNRPFPTDFAARIKQLEQDIDGLRGVLSMVRYSVNALKSCPRKHLGDRVNNLVASITSDLREPQEEKVCPDDEPWHWDDGPDMNEEGDK